jgi:hypothetical protein
MLSLMNMFKSVDCHVDITIVLDDQWRGSDLFDNLGDSGVSLNDKRVEPSLRLHFLSILNHFDAQSETDVRTNF